jgi:hypothetical protein
MPPENALTNSNTSRDGTALIANRRPGSTSGAEVEQNSELWTSAPSPPRTSKSQRGSFPNTERTSITARLPAHGLERSGLIVGTAG